MNSEPPNKVLIHLWWTIGLLSLILIASITFQVSDDENVVSLISVATGLVSLVVGLIAIVYAFFTNGSLSDSGNRLERSSKSIEEAAKQTIHSINTLRAEIAPVAQQVSEIHSKMPVASQGGQSTQSSPPQTAGQTLTADSLIEYFVTSASWIGILTIYAAIERFKLGKPFNPYIWTSSVSSISPDYAIGYFVCTACTGLIDYDRSTFLQQGNILLQTIHFPTLDQKVPQLSPLT